MGKLFAHTLPGKGRDTKKHVPLVPQKYTSLMKETDMK